MSIVRKLTQGTLTMAGAAAVGLISLWSPPTQAIEVADYERAGEWDEDGQRFGNIIVKGELVPTANGYTLLRTFENKSDEAESCDLEERVLRTESSAGSRSSPAPVAVIQRRQRVALKPHETKKVGVYLAPALERQVAENANLPQMLLARNDYSTTYYTFAVDYLRPLQPGETAAPLKGRDFMP
jgi:hypothetical protein